MRGICRIDQPEKHNHGFFVRVQREGKLCSTFFADRKHGGKAKALTAAKVFYEELLAIVGPRKTKSRQWWAEIRRRKGSSNVVGVQKIVNRRFKRPRIYWQATWSPEPYVVRRKMFSAAKHGARQAKRLAIRARRAGVRSMVS
jgi:hypothetical protein